MSDYSDKLKDPRWQRKRLEIMGRDNFQCQRCFDYDSTLVVHHKWYSKGFEPWEYENDCYVTLCDDCHDGFHRYFEPKANNQHEIIQGINATDVYIYNYHKSKLIQKQGISGFKLFMQNLLSMIIKEEDI